MRGALLALLLSTAASSARCLSGDATAELAGRGPYGVGVRTLTLVDPSRGTPAHGPVAERPTRTLVTEVWYPTAGDGTVRDAPLARGRRFPLVVDSHGLSDFRESREYYTAALASRGFVVAAPDYPVSSLRSGAPDAIDTVNQPGDVRFVIDTLLSLAATRGGWLAGGLDRRRIGVSGLSLGGLTTLLVTYHPTLRDPRVRAALPIAPVACFLTDPFFATARPPLLVLHGTDDLLASYFSGGARVFQHARSTRQLVTLAHGTHLAFVGLLQCPAPEVASCDAGFCASGFFDDLDLGVFAALGGTREGIDPGACTTADMPCGHPAPFLPTMAQERQKALTTAVVAAFFTSTLGHSPSGRCFLRRQLVAENPDVDSARAPADPLGDR